MCTPISDMRVGQTGVMRVGEPCYLVLQQTVEGTLVLKPDGAIELLESGYAIKVSRETEAVLNTQSHIVHMTLNGQPVCGSRHSQNSITVEKHLVNCERCKEICKL